VRLGRSSEAGSTTASSSTGAGTATTGAGATTVGDATTTDATTTDTTSPDATTDAADSSGASEDTGPPPADCDVELPLEPGDYERTLDHGGVMRRYFLHVSPSAESSAPLVVNMHGFLSNPTMQSDWSEMIGAADPRGIIVVHPEGLDNSWNAGSCCGNSSGSGVDDVGFIRAMVEDVASAACVDPQRVYATGLSNGGFLSNRLACEASDLFAAVAPVVGALRIPYEECVPERPMPVFAFNGVQDPLVPIADGESTIDRWVEIDGCDPEPIVEELDGGICRTWTGCDGDGDVRMCTLDPMGHCWPGHRPDMCYAFLGPYSETVDATERMLDFFDEHSLP
jgi:polyhydroxybutyrate depolymerase